MKMNTPVHDFLIEHVRRKPISFHMPGHKGAEFYKRFGFDPFLKNIMDCDITEIVGADNLFQAEGIIQQAQERYADLYEVKKSYFLVNGTSGGIIAAIAASVPKGRKLIMARNCHKSVFNALALADIRPVYAYPEEIKAYGISGAITAEEIERLLSANSDAEAVILPSPNYYGICSDIKRIAEIVHKHHKVLIVDQAHGAHLKFFSKFGIAGTPLSAEESGADLIINSIHKTLGSFTQSAILNLNSDRVDPLTLEDKLQAIESTSPSYLLMASLDINASIIERQGRELFSAWADSLDCFYERAAKCENLQVIDRLDGLDRTKINFSLEGAGISGAEAEKILIEEHNIFIELFTGNLVMCMTGIGNTKSDLVKLAEALAQMAANKRAAQENKVRIPAPVQRSQLYGIPKKKMRIGLENAEGKICASSIIPYPPGIPFICPGEEITGEAINYIKELRDMGEKVIGVSVQGEILVGG